MGWALAPPAVRDKLVLAAEAAVLCPPSFSQIAISTYLQSYSWQEQVKVFRKLSASDGMRCSTHYPLPCRPDLTGRVRPAGSMCG